MYISRKKKIIFIVFFVVFLLFLFIAFASNVFKSDKLLPINKDIEAGENIDTLSLVKLGDDYKNYIVSAKSEKITLNKTGKTTITYYIRKNGESKKEKVEVSFNVVDTTPPDIKTEDVLSVAYGSEFNIKNLVSVYDNVDERINDIDVSGEVNTKKLGQYKITVTAKDSSKNTAEKEILVSVVNPYLPYEDISSISGKWLNKEDDLILSFFNNYGRAKYSVSVKGELSNYNGFVSSIDVNGNKITLVLSYNASNWQEGESPDYKFAKMVLIKDDNKLTLKSFMKYKDIDFSYAGESWQEVDEKYTN
ncbi:immunoglobulin-like domain-containing protein [Anaerofustis sp. HA2171]|uniref:immunoglobulin-like domain-containing protein n=1 Tax=Anaerofustis butyriciformans TaxID=3108533 RepID=UPI002E316C35|nr:immunoglobulin-like domain-containing protein [Anaerofustis sp. HA2171]